jgi:hypothetical protein
MKIKFWQFEYDFDRDDAKIIVPMILLLVAISATTLNPQWLLAGSHHILSFVFLLDGHGRGNQRLHCKEEDAMPKVPQ